MLGLTVFLVCSLENFVRETTKKWKILRNWDLLLVRSKTSKLFESSEYVAPARLLPSSTTESSKLLQAVASRSIRFIIR